MAGFALVWHITLQTTSGLWLAVATIACNGPQILLLLWGGVWADRYNRRFLIILSDGFAAFVTLLLALTFLWGAENLWLLLGALTLRSLGGGVQSPAAAAMYTQIVPPEHLHQVQGINQTINAVFTLIAPAFGGLLPGLTSLAAAMLVDVITAISAIAVILRIPSAQPFKNGPEPFNHCRDASRRIIYPSTSAITPFTVRLRRLLFSACAGRRFKPFDDRQKLWGRSLEADGQRTGLVGNVHSERCSYCLSPRVRR